MDLLTLKADTAKDVLLSAAKVGSLLAVGCAGAVTVALGYSGIYYLWMGRKYRKLPRRKKWMPVWDAFDQQKGEEAFINEFRDPDQPGEFQTVVDMGPDFNGNRIVAFSDPETFAKILNDTQTFGKAPNAGAEELIGKDSLVMSEGELWARQRKLITPVFHFSSLKAVFDTMVDIAVKDADDMQHQIETSKDHCAIRTKEDFNALTMRIIIACAFSSRFDVEWMHRAWGKVFHSIFYFIGRQIVGPLWNYIPHKDAWGVAAVMKQINRKVQAEIDTRRKDGTDTAAKEGEGPRDLLDLLMAAGDEMSDRLMIDESLTFLSAGHETTSSLVSWTMYCLSKHPDVQRQLQEELDAVIGDRPLTFDDINRLEYMKCVVKEVLRLCPPAPFLDRLAKRDFSLNGYDLPKGTIVWLMFHAAQMDERYWDKPQEFMPSRWAEGSGTETAAEGGATKALRHPYAYLPFSAGPRNCIGQKFAQQEASVILASVMRHYDVALEGEDKVMGIIEATMVPKNLSLRFTPRGTCAHSVASGTTTDGGA
ncbi:unnamed protein product [Vitrella brassicaformis CCMP3155]|uniref:Cytochrome P450 n=1 Tax=Vitrella brassicaformis (strain CCMP3155) TaxID=1169540 RepID=A0A0G4FS81_VITBC|nr:unnamed protein product [Vitrella brassicaformis CCMP3155]|eukprot:CEM17207.1 unnamed protein product [Vitrella brassicaformis CCMP3155]